MEAGRSFETSVTYHNTAWRNNPEDHDLNIHCRESLKFPMRDELVFPTKAEIEA
jgi:hypothetical protein